MTRKIVKASLSHNTLEDAVKDDGEWWVFRVGDALAPSVREDKRFTREWLEAMGTTRESGAQPASLEMTTCIGVGGFGVVGEWTWGEHAWR